MKSVLIAGELNPDLLLQGYQSFPALGKEVLVDDFVSTLGSASAICAAGLARLGDAGRVRRQGRRRRLGRLLDERAEGARRRRLARPPRSNAQDRRHRVGHIGRPTAL